MKKRLGFLFSLVLFLIPALFPWFYFDDSVSCWRGVQLLRWTVPAVGIAGLSAGLIRQERIYRLVQLAVMLAVSCDYALAFLGFPERANLAGGINVDVSWLAVRNGYWVAGGLWLLYVIGNIVVWIRRGAGKCFDNNN